MPKLSFSVILGGLCALVLLTVGTVIFFVWRGLADAEGRPRHRASHPPAALTYVPQEVGFPVQGHPMITHVLVADLEQTGLPGILVCDATANRIGWIRQAPRGVFTEQFIGDPVEGPAHIALCDVNGDGRPDLLIASMGQILPNNDRIGKIIVMENLGGLKFHTHVIAENIARVTDVRGADLAGHGRMDLAVGQYGYNQGEVRWMENLGDWKFVTHNLVNLPGAIMTPVGDFTHSGRNDIAALLSQDCEQVYGQVRLFRNLGGGEFQDSLLWKTDNISYGCSGLWMADINGDGRPDLAVSNGDGFNSAFAAAAPWHGLQWLENKGNGSFEYHRIGDSAGCYSPVCVDLSGKGRGHLDIVTVSAFTNSLDADAVTLTAWVNDGHEHFTAVPLAYEPTRLLTVAAGDLDGNGIPVLVTGGMYAYPPYAKMSRVAIWRRQ